MTGKQKMFQDTGIDNDFLNRTLIAQEIRPVIDTEDYTKLKLLCIKGYNYQNKETTYRMEEKFSQVLIV
jgi:hypothetical protein